MDRRSFLVGSGALAAGLTLDGRLPAFAQLAPRAFLDARTDDVGETLQADICIIGAGAAGITLARELSKTVQDVLLIESGALDIEGETQSLFSGRNIGLAYHDLLACRLRYFGGTTNHWSGFCRANDPIDYEERPEAGLPGWPIRHSDLEPFVARAADSLGIRSEFFEPHALLQQAGLGSEGLIDDHSSRLQTKVFQIATDIRLGPANRETLEQSENLRVVLNLNAVHLQLAQNGMTLENVDCATTNGKRVRINARQFILACHSIETARLLLVSNDVATTGIGNGSDHVGRYFMDHIYVKASRFIPDASFPRTYSFDFSRKHGINANLGFSDEVIREIGIPQYYCRFWPVYAEPEVARAVEELRADFWRPGGERYLRDLATALLNPVGSAEHAASLYIDHLPPYFELDHRLEQTPNPNSRVVISDRRDSLGSLSADLDWELSEPDYRGLALGQEEIAKELTKLGYGTFELETITPELVRERALGHFHHIGTARMSATPEGGVVDRDCKVHGVDNLYICGSSVFPTAGYSGPTMMIIGLSMRLADHLSNALRS